MTRKWFEVWAVEKGGTEKIYVFGFPTREDAERGARELEESGATEIEIREVEI